MTPLRGSLTLHGDRMIVTELPSMEKPDIKDYPYSAIDEHGFPILRYDRKKFDADTARYNEHIVSLRIYPAIGFPSSRVGQTVECELEKQFNIMDSDKWIPCDEDYPYEDMIEEYRRIVAIPVTAPIGNPNRVYLKIDRATLPKDGQKVKFLDDNEQWHDGEFVEGDDIFYVSESIWFFSWNVGEWESLEPATTPIGKPGESEGDRKFSVVEAKRIWNAAKNYATSPELFPDIVTFFLKEYNIDVSFDQRLPLPATGTQGDGEGPLLTEINSVIFQRIKDEQINKHIKPMFNSLDAASIEYFLQTQTVNGGFRQALNKMMDVFKSASPQPSPVRDEEIGGDLWLEVIGIASESEFLREKYAELFEKLNAKYIIQRRK